MKAEINENGILIIKVESEIESYALQKWWQENVNGCTGTLKDDIKLYKIMDVYCERPKVRFHKTLWLKFRLWLYR